MVYAYDRAIEMPTVDLYDTRLMAMAVQTAKDMYDKGELQIKDFNKDFGDFYSPIDSDMNWYKTNVTDKVKNTIDSLYAAGIDPIRSAEGRLAVRAAINSVDAAAVALRKQAAKNAEQYIKSRNELMKAGLWNPEFERQQLGGLLLEKWDGKKPWTATSATPYLDYQQKYGHLFKDMGYKYNPIESQKHPGMIVMTKSRDDMNDILSQHVPDLQKDPQYMYDLNKVKENIKLMNPGMTDNDALPIAEKALHDEIVNRNFKDDMKMQQDPVEMAKIKYDYARLLKQIPQATSRTSGNRYIDNPNAVGWTKRQKTAVMLNYKNNSKSMPIRGLTASKFYGLLQAIPLGADKTTALALAAGISNPEQIDVGINSKRMPVMFGSNDLSITPKRQNEYYDAYTASPKLKYNFGAAVGKNTKENINKAIINNFDLYLKRNHIEGYIPSTDVSVNYNTNNENDVFDINTYSRVKKSDLDGYFNTKEKFINLGKALGLIAVLNNGRRVEITGKNKNSLVWDNVEYIDIPITRTIESVGYGNSTIDTFHDDISLGNSTASKRQRIYETEDESDFIED